MSRGNYPEWMVNHTCSAMELLMKKKTDVSMGILTWSQVKHMQMRVHVLYMGNKNKPMAQVSNRKIY